MLFRRVQFFTMVTLFAFALPAWSQVVMPQATDAVRLDHKRVVDSLRSTFSPYSDSTTVTRGGRTDTVMLTKTSWDTVLDTFQGAHSRMTKMRSGGTVAGWYVNKTKRSATFTVHLNGHSYTVAAKELSNGTKLTVWGNARNHKDIRRASRAKVSRSGAVPGLSRL